MSNSFIVMVNREKDKLIPTVERMTAYLLILVALKQLGNPWLAILPWKVILEPTALLA
jgi:hypothetical protein